MWKSRAGVPLDITSNDDDDWETDPDFVNDVTEQEQRWGSKTIPGSGRIGDSIDMNKLREEVTAADATRKKKELENSNPSFGYGGKFGVESDRMDQCAVGHDYVANVEKHGSQVDYRTGFGGKFGVQSDRVDKCAATYDSVEKLQKHSSQKDYAAGFGGKYGVQKDRQDKCAVGWDHREKVEKHESQKDYAVGFGGKFGIQKDRQDKSAVGYDHSESIPKHHSQTDHKKGFGGQFGVENDRVDKSAHQFSDDGDKIGTNYVKEKPLIGSVKPSHLREKFENMAKQSESSNKVLGGAKPSQLRSKFENLAKQSEEDSKKRLEEEQEKRRLRDLQEKKEAQKREESRLTKLSEKENEEQSKLNHCQSVPENSVPNSEKIKNNIFIQKDSVKSPQPEPVATQPQRQPENKRMNSLEQRLLSSMQNSPLLANDDDDDDDVSEPVVNDKVSKLENSTVTEKPHNEPEYPSNGHVEPSKPVSNEVYTSKDDDDASTKEEQQITEIDIVDTGYKALALYDYQASAEDEISFDPDDLITHIEMIDEGWWRGYCKGQYGLFPANYVALQ